MQNSLKMTAIELKHTLINRIAEIDDVSFLKAIKTMLDTKTETKVQAIQINFTKDLIKNSFIAL